MKITDSMEALLGRLTEDSKVVISEKEARAQVTPRAKITANALASGFKGWKVPMSTEDENEKRAVTVRVEPSKWDNVLFKVSVEAKYPDKYARSLYLSFDVAYNDVHRTYGRPIGITVQPRVEMFSTLLHYGFRWSITHDMDPKKEARGVVSRLRKDVDNLFVKYFAKQGRPGWAR